MGEKSAEGWLRWEPCARELGERVSAQLTTELPRFFGGANFEGGRTAELPFYEDHVLVELVIDSNQTTETAFTLYGSDRAMWLNGESTPIHEVNDVESLRLTDDTVETYLRFFLLFLRGDCAAFVLIESSDQLRLEADDHQDDEGVEALASMRSEIKPLVRDVDDERWEFDANVAYDGVLFSATFAVAFNGVVEMTDDQPRARWKGSPFQRRRASSSQWHGRRTERSPRLWWGCSSMKPSKI